MDLPLNHSQPGIMHIDLNSCFATAEQQANPLIRGKPVVVAAYTTASGCIISPSIEAKKLGIRVGMQVRDAKMICQEIIVLPPDPPKYRDIHIKFNQIFRDYSPNVSPKSIDEAVIDFTGTRAFKRGLINIGKEIKTRMKQEIGVWISASIGISTNRFLAKLAASLHKPDGLDVINYQNLEEIYRQASLLDFCGINTRFQARLNASNIFTPIDFLQAPLDLLRHQVFKSIIGYYWYLRIRGWEIDAIDFVRKSYGQSYALPRPVNNRQELAKLLMKLCEKMGRRLRKSGHLAYGIHIACLYNDQTFWHQAKKFHTPLYTTYELYAKALLVFNNQPENKKVTHLSVSCYDLISTEVDQLDLFASDQARQRKLSDALDTINDKYGEYIITPAMMMGMDKVIIDRVAFGGVKDLEDIYL
ncbi:MAG: hypothetical protein V1858_03295 [Candidatus Gottesmanbacteria bacterium]